MYSQGDVDYPVHTEDSAAYGLSGGYQVYAYGRARPHARARIELYGGTWTVDVDADGWWLLVDDAPKKGFEKAMAAEDARWRSIRAEFGCGANHGIYVHERSEDAPDGSLPDPFGSQLRVTVE